MKLFKDTMFVLEGIRLETEGTSIETDIIVINDKGLFSIEVKNYGESGSGRITVGKDGKWTRYNNEDKEIPIEDPMHQVNRHIGFGQRLLNNKLAESEYVYMQPLIVIANDNIHLENLSDTAIVRVSNVYNYILNFKPEKKLEYNLQKRIRDILIEENKGSKPYPLKGYSEYIKKTLPNIESNYKILIEYFKKI